MAAGRIAGKEIGLPDLSNQRAIKEAYGIQTWITGLYPATLAVLNAEVMTGGSWTVTTVGGNKVATMVKAGIDNQPAGGCAVRLTVTTADNASDDLAGTLEIQGRNAFGDPVREEVTIAAGVDTQTTDGAFSEINQLKVTMASGIYDAADTIALAAVADEIVFGPIKPIEVSGAAAFPNIFHITKCIGTGADPSHVQLTLKANNATATSGTFQVKNISANGECAVGLHTDDDPDAKVSYTIMFRYQNGTAL